MISSPKSNQPLESTSSLSFKERLQNQLNKAKQIQKIAQTDLYQSQNGTLANQIQSQILSPSHINDNNAAIMPTHPSTTSSTHKILELKTESQRLSQSSQISSQKSYSQNSSLQDPLNNFQNQENKENLKVESLTKTFQIEQLNKKVIEKQEIALCFSLQGKIIEQQQLQKINNQKTALGVLKQEEKCNQKTSQFKKVQNQKEIEDKLSINKLLLSEIVGDSYLIALTTNNPKILTSSNDELSKQLQLSQKFESDIAKNNGQQTQNEINTQKQFIRQNTTINQESSNFFLLEKKLPLMPENCYLNQENKLEKQSETVVSECQIIQWQLQKHLEIKNNSQQRNGELEIDEEIQVVSIQKQEISDKTSSSYSHLFNKPILNSSYQFLNEISEQEDETLKKDENKVTNEPIFQVKISNKETNDTNLKQNDKGFPLKKQINLEEVSTKSQVQKEDVLQQQQKNNHNSQNILERIKKHSYQKESSLLELIANENPNYYSPSRSLCTPSQRKENYCNVNNQFSNDSFGIIPQKIQFLPSTLKKEGKTEESQEIKIKQILQDVSNSEQRSCESIQKNQQVLSTQKTNSKSVSPNAKIEEIRKIPSVRLKSSQRIFESERILKSKSKSLNNNHNQKEDNQKIFERNNSRERSRSPLTSLKKSINKSVGREDLLLSSAKINRFNLTPTQEEVNEVSKIQEQDLQSEISRIAKILSISKFNKNQVQFFESVYGQRQNVFKLMLNQSGKNILYQALALIEDSIPQYFIVIVTNYFMTLKQKLNKQVSWACINTMMGIDVLVQVQNLLLEKKIKLLFIQAEQLEQDQLKFMKGQIKMIIYEDMSEKTIIEINKTYQVSCYHLFCTQGFKIYEQITNICSNLQLKNLDDPIQLFGFDFSHIHWSFENDKDKCFLNFIRKNNLKRVLFFVDINKKLEEIVSSFNQKGMKMVAYCQQKQEQLSQLFSKDQFEILCLHSGTIVPKSIKQLAQYFIHYQLPKNILTYLSDINGFQFYHLSGRGIQFDKFACGFLSDQDFYDVRQAMVSELTDKKLITTIIKTLSIQKNLNNDENDSSKKGKGTIQDNFFFNVVPDEKEKKIQGHYENLLTLNNNLIEENNYDNIKQIQITKFSSEHYIKRESLIKILSFLTTDKVNIMPFTASIQISQKSQFQNDKIISKILQQKNHAHFNIIQMAQNLQMTSQELHKILKKLQGEKKIQYDVKEEIALLSLKPNLDNTLNKLYEEIRFQEEKQINEFDAMYISARITCNLTLDQVFKYQKYKEVSSKYIQQSLPEEISSLNLKNILEKYLSTSEGKKMCSIFSSSEKAWLPFIPLKSQREKSNLLKDIQMLIPLISKSKLNIPEFQQNQFAYERDLDQQSRFIAMILQGIEGKYICEFKPAQQFKKYYKYDYFDLLQIIYENLWSHYSLLTTTIKKIKI